LSTPYPVLRYASIEFSPDGIATVSSTGRDTLVGWSEIGRISLARRIPILRTHSSWQVIRRLRLVAFIGILGFALFGRAISKGELAAGFIGGPLMALAVYALFRMMWPRLCLEVATPRRVVFLALNGEVRPAELTAFLAHAAQTYGRPVESTVAGYEIRPSNVTSLEARAQTKKSVYPTEPGGRETARAPVLPARELAWQQTRHGFVLRWQGTGGDAAFALGSGWCGAGAVYMGVQFLGKGEPGIAVALFAMALVSLGPLLLSVRPFLNRTTFLFDEQRFTCRTTPLTARAPVDLRLATITTFASTPLARLFPGITRPSQFGVIAETRSGVSHRLNVMLSDENEASFVAEELNRMLMARRPQEVGGPFRVAVNG
jgi:hypothetical protein